MISVITPTYNRKEKLLALYQSLLQQDNTVFEWIIVDDGSVDDTEKFVNDIIETGKLKIQYIKKENGGKPSAYNVGLEHANGDIFFCIDSDDILGDNVLSVIESDFNNVSDDIAGIMYMQGDIHSKKIIGTNFPDNLIDTYYNVYNKYHVIGDKLIVLKTNVAREFYFPLIPGEKFIPEALIYNRMSKKYKLMCSNNVMAYKEYLDGGYSSNYFNLVKKNPNGNALYFLEAYELNKSIYNVYGYLLFSFYAKKSFLDIIKHPAKFWILLLYIPVFIISIIRK